MTDFKELWLRFETWIWAGLLIVQLSMVAFLLLHGRKEGSFRRAFYVFFVAVTIVDCALVLLVSCGDIATTTTSVLNLVL